MNPYEQYIAKGKIILTISVIFLALSIMLYVSSNLTFDKKDYEFTLSTYNIQEMAKAKVSVKKQKKNNIFTTIVSNISTETSKFEPVTLENKNKEEVVEEPVVNKQIWYLPTEKGYITQYAHAGHMALDITSGRGTNERIYPVADGVISGIYKDNAGALIVTVSHNINGQYYSSEYAHLSWYASGIYVGKPVTVNDPLGGMGATGIATGIHLHITVLDCNLFDPNDPNCATKSQFYNYRRTRFNQGFYGLSSLMQVPYSWQSR